jgi:hypothetical protein
MFWTTSSWCLRSFSSLIFIFYFIYSSSFSLSRAAFYWLLINCISAFIYKLLASDFILIDIFFYFYTVKSFASSISFCLNSFKYPKFSNFFLCLI